MGNGSKETPKPECSQAVMLLVTWREGIKGGAGNILDRGGSTEDAGTNAPIRPPIQHRPAGKTDNR